MRPRPWWTRTGVIGVGVLLAGALGAWQAARLSEALGFGPGAAPESRQARRAAPTGAERRGPPPAGAWAGPVDPWREPGSGWSALAPHPGPALPVEHSAARWPAPWPSAAILSGTPAPETEAEAAERLTGEMQRLASDLEFSPGLREPPQQVVAKAPATWHPPPEAAGRAPPIIEAISPRTGPASGGVEVVLRGRDLRAAQVMFGAAPGRIVASSPTEVTVAAPPGRPGPVRVALTNAEGTYALAAEPFTYTP